mgnify:CR=1 FL=1
MEDESYTFGEEEGRRGADVIVCPVHLLTQRFRRERLFYL